MKLVYESAKVFIFFVAHQLPVLAQEVAPPEYTNPAGPIAFGDVPIHWGPAIPGVGMQFPEAHPAGGVNFSQLVPAKIDMDHNPPQIIFLIASFRQEVKKVDVMQPKIKMVTQTFTRTDGTTAEREVAVTEFVSVQILQPFLQPAGLKPTSMNLADFELYDLNSEPISREEAARALPALRPIFVIDRFNGALPPIGKYEKQVLKPDVLIATTKLAVHSAHQIGGPQAPGVAMPFFPVGGFGGRPIPNQMVPLPAMPVAPPDQNSQPKQD